MTASLSTFRESLNIRANETRLAALVIVVMLLTSAGFTLGSSAVEALFFTRYGVQYLPGMYMLLGLLSFASSLGMTALLGRIRRAAQYLLIPFGVVILTILAWGLLFSGWTTIYPVLWLGKEIINTLLSFLVWGLAGTVCDPRQSKRLFPLFNAGRILGTVLGGVGTGLLVNLMGTQNLMLVWSGLLLLALWTIRILVKGYLLPVDIPSGTHNKRKSSLIHEMQNGFQYVRRSALMRWISVAAVLFSVLYFSIALPFSKVATAHFSDENALAGFLGLFNALSTAAAFLASVFLANRLYARFGIMDAILVLPVIYLLGFGGLFLTQAFLLIVIFRFTQTLWLSGVADSAYQAMFNAVPATRRDQVRAFVTGVPEQAGTFIAGGVLLVGQQAFSARQLAFVGLLAALATTFVIWRARRAYSLALVDALHAGQVTIFARDDRRGVQLDSMLINVALDGLVNPDPVLRRISAMTLGQVDLPSSTSALVHALQDQDAEVRCAALISLARPSAAPALLEIAKHLEDAWPAARSQAVDTLRAITPFQNSLRPWLDPLLQDAEPTVHVRAAVGLACLGGHPDALAMLRQMSMLGNVDERVLALQALAEVGDPQALPLFEMELQDLHAPPAVRHAAACALGQCGPAALSTLQAALSTTDNVFVQSGLASAFNQIGEAALPVVLDALSNPLSERAALDALEQLPTWKEPERVREYAQNRIQSSLHYESFRQALQTDHDERLRLMDESLLVRARRDGIFALRAIRMLMVPGSDSDHATLASAIEHLQNRDPSQHSIALEALETIRSRQLVRPLIPIWESGQALKPALGTQAVLENLQHESDLWLQACANYCLETFSKDQPMNTLPTFSILDRVVWLRRVPLLTALSPEELQRVAVISNEQNFVDGDLICQQGEPGDEMYLIISGKVSISVGHAGLAAKQVNQRGAGDVVGEMSIITGDARVASVIALDEVRTLCLERLSFQSLLRERPEVSLAVMRELCNRLKQLM